MPSSEPQVRVVHKPVVPRKAGEKARSANGAGEQDEAGIHSNAAHAAAHAASAPDPFLRAENEDDDGYDPYSDRPAEREPLFEANPWN
ncbi:MULTISPECIES: hypothetical protein [unclassified Adlercreutzia]|uniref:hypothetical protein n=1 Tax=unclassified Adlercreutzia TaxID=2636013 RepID=UPI0013ECB0F4|nr:MULTISPECIES: hypothetical protein [unclassified Adlercreutzia]